MGLKHSRYVWNGERGPLTEFTKIRHLDGVTAQTTWHDSLKDLPERYGASLRFLRHGDLHTGLLKHLEATEGHPVKLNLETNIADLDCEKGIIRTSDGAEVEKDTIVLANGLGVITLALLNFLLISAESSSSVASLNTSPGTTILCWTPNYPFFDMSLLLKSSTMTRIFGLYLRIRMTKYASSITLPQERLSSLTDAKGAEPVQSTSLQDDLRVTGPGQVRGNLLTDPFL